MLKEFEDEEWSIFIVAMLCLAIFIFSEWVFVNVAGEVKALWYATASILVLMISLLEFYLKHKIPYIRVAFFGNSKNALIGGAVGLVTALFIVGQSFSIGGQNIGLALAFSFVPQSILEIMYVVILSPLIEEFVFRGILVFTTFYSMLFVMKKFKFRTGDDSMIAALTAILLPNTLFGFYHYLVSGGDPNFITTAFSLGVIWTLGYLVFRSIAFPVVFHMVNNAIVSQIPVMDIIVTVVIVGASVIVLYYFIAPLTRSFPILGRTRGRG